MRLLVLALLLALAGPAGALTITVTNTNPSGPGSLRQAVIDANNNIAGGNIINVPASMGVLAQDGTLPLIKDIELNCGGGSVITTGGFKASAATPLLKLGSFDGLAVTAAPVDEDAAERERQRRFFFGPRWTGGMR